MKPYEKTIWVSLLALLVLALSAVIITRGWSDYRERLRAIRLASKSASNLVDTHPLDTAQQVAPLAVTHTEEDYAGQALRLADLSVDLEFSAAMHDAAENPAPLTPKTRDLAARVKSGTAAVAADQARISVFTAAMARAKGSAKDDLQDLIGIAQAQVALDQDDLEDAQQELIRSGGDKQATIQQLLDQRKAAGTQNATSQAGPPAGSAPSIELTQSKSIAAQSRAWTSLRSKEKLLLQAQADALARAARLSSTHESLEKGIAPGNPPAQIAGPADLSRAAPEANTPLSRLHQQTEDKKNLADINRRIATEQQLATVYSSWADLVNARAKGFLHEIFLSVFWVLLIGLLVLAANALIQRLFAGVALERREMHTMRALILFALQALGLLSILLVIFGIPTNLATVLALAGAGLTVAMKDFIVGFFGWFVLMGKDGIRAGDWVEINGVGGEVLKVGLLHTVLLETGSWTDAGHPTGRQVSFVNSFAIEGHFFNFSTSGQWLWDEIEAQVPENADPYATGEALQKIAAEETAANSKLAETEWNRLTPSSEKRALSAAPSLSVRPTASGVNIVLRYLTRANERHAVRARLYHAAVDLLRKKQISEPAAPTTSPEPAPRRT
ncbi:MAG TPA: mechanosensitive ion channel domain-containing protein [Candidatus Acidoferrales bacterium]|jgi:small-conductance mechanosensitive channel|nr:mechanosensitive ion channel domain-containing protein [Candidatus Acidoferrales bacterium]